MAMGISDRYFPISDHVPDRPTFAHQIMLDDLAHDLREIAQGHLCHLVLLEKEKKTSLYILPTFKVVVPVYAIHNDPNIYPNPDIFDPDRFLPENIKTRHPISFMGFSAGPRTCIGNKFATCQVKVLLANILANFKLVKCNKTAEKMKLNPLLLMPVAEGGIWLQFQEL
ncbi:hypothetical protein J6590_074826 [Homalodisca vitripennis]|nr:hypothetical protein J6590_074826 [Homalodisca vitripennis]